tara:strand:+ start:43 stop:522 length:480 start_codon:yes stop_codon:yes gene_type:complete
MNDIIPTSLIIVRENKKFVQKNIADYFVNKKIIAFALPGAFTPTCSDYHLPAYEQEFENLCALGVDDIYCISMNDPYVIEKWQESSGINKIKFIPDGNGTFTKDMNMISDRSSSGMGERSYRYSMYVENKKIVKLFKDENGKFDVSDPKTMINFLKERK